MEYINLQSHHRGVAMKIVPNVHPPMIVLYGGETTASKLCFGFETGNKCTNRSVYLSASDIPCAFIEGSDDLYFCKNFTHQFSGYRPSVANICSSIRALVASGSWWWRPSPSTSGKWQLVVEAFTQHRNKLQGPLPVAFYQAAGDSSFVPNDGCIGNCCYHAPWWEVDTFLCHDVR